MPKVVVIAEQHLVFSREIEVTEAELSQMQARAQKGGRTICTCWPRTTYPTRTFWRMAATRPCGCKWWPSAGFFSPSFSFLFFMALPQGSHYPVYPQPGLERGKADQRNRSDKGLTLLDHFAGQALPVAQRRLESLEASYIDRPPIRHQGTAAQVAVEAYDLAEAVLSERTARLKAAEAAPAA